MATMYSPVLLFFSQDEMIQSIDLLVFWETGLHFTIILTGPLKCWGSWHVPSCLVAEYEMFNNFIFKEPSSGWPFPHGSHFIRCVILLSESRWSHGNDYCSSKCLQRNYIEENPNESKSLHKSRVATR